MSKIISALGIWMDHQDAHLIEWTTPPMETKKISSKFTYLAKHQSLNESERLMHNKEQHEQGDFYKHLGEEIKKHKEVVLFGPSDAKAELFNLLKADHGFSDIKFQIIPAGRMTDNQEHAFVREHFSKHIF